MTDEQAAPKDDEVQADAPAAEETTAPAEEAPAEEAAAPEAEVEVPEKFKAFVEQIEGMSVLELHELVKVLEKKFDVSAAAVAVAAPGAGGDGEDAGDATVSVELKDAGAQKIQVIKAIKELLGLGLKEAKDLVDGAPSMIKSDISKEEAEEIKGKIEEAGGAVEIK